MILLAFALSFVLLVITVLHVYWGIGGVWPGRDAASCAHAVVGFRGVSEMPSPFASFAVAACLGLATLFSFVAYGIVGLPTLSAAIVVTILTSGINFLILRRWAFAGA